MQPLAPIDSQAFQLVLKSVSVRRSQSPGINISAGPGTRRLLIRAAGPALTPLGVPGVLADPTLAVTNPTASTTYAANNDWGTPIGTNPASAVAIAAAIANYTGYPFAAGSRDSAVIADLAPGAYTVQVSGVADTSGVALVEIYDITQETQTITFAALSDRTTTSAPQNLSATASSGEPSATDAERGQHEPTRFPNGGQHGTGFVHSPHRKLDPARRRHDQPLPHYRDRRRGRLAPYFHRLPNRNQR